MEWRPSIAKSVFQVHAISEAGDVVVRQQWKRRQVLQFFAGLRPCLIGMEARATAHHWARELIKLGQRVRLMPLRYVKPYVKRNKNDAADAESICEAVTRPTMRLGRARKNNDIVIVPAAERLAGDHRAGPTPDQDQTSERTLRLGRSTEDSTE